MENTRLFSRPWLTVALLWGVGCLNYIDRLMITTMRGSIKEAIPMTDAQFALLTTSFLIVYAGLSPFAGFLADRFGRARVIILSLFAWSIVTWLTAHARTYEQLIVSRALMGVSEACYMPAALALVTDFHRGATRSLAVGVHMTGVLAGGALGGLGGWLAEEHTWNYPFSFFGLFGLGYAAVLLLCLRDRNDRATDELPATSEPAVRVRFFEAVSSLLKSRPYIVTIFYWALTGVGWAVTGWMPTYLNEQFHLKQGAAGLSATGYLYGAGLAGLLIGGAWSDFWSRTNPRARIYVPVIGLCVAAPAILLVSNTTVLALALAGLTAYGMSYAFCDSNMMPILCLITDPKYRATGYGLLNSFGNAVGAMAIYVVGVLRDSHVETSRIFAIGSITFLVSAAFLLFVKPGRLARS